jgi:hypothetical protein
MSVTIKQAQQMVKNLEHRVANPDEYLRAAHGDRGPIVYREIVESFVAQNTAALKRLERRINAAQHVKAERKELASVCGHCFTVHAGECL